MLRRQCGLLCLLLFLCTWTKATEVGGPLNLFHITREGFIPAVSVKAIEEEVVDQEGSGVEDVEISLKELIKGSSDLNNETDINSNSAHIQEFDSTTQKDDYQIMQKANGGKDDPSKAYLRTTEDSAVSTGLIVGISLLLATLVCSLFIIFCLYKKLRSLRSEKTKQVPGAKEADYDSDEYSVMMDWSEPDVKETLKKPVV